MFTVFAITGECHQQNDGYNNGWGYHKPQAIFFNLLITLLSVTQKDLNICLFSQGWLYLPRLICVPESASILCETRLWLKLISSQHLHLNDNLEFFFNLLLIQFEKEDEIVAQFKFTTLLMPNGPLRITGLPFDVAECESDKKIEDEEILVSLDYLWLLLIRRHRNSWPSRPRRSQRSATRRRPPSRPKPRPPRRLHKHTHYPYHCEIGY